MPKRTTKPLTEKIAAAIKAPKTGYTERFDGRIPGLALRVYSTGTRSWTLHYRTGAGDKRSIHLGDYGDEPNLSVDAARKKAEQVRANVHEGRDPLAERGVERERARDTVAALFDRYQKASEGTMRSWPEVRRIFKTDVLPYWRDRPVSSLTRRDVVDLVGKKAKAAPTMANRIHSRVSAFLTFGVKAGWIEQNVARDIDPPGGEEESRERYLSDDELRIVWTALQESEKTDENGKKLLRLNPTMNDLFMVLLLAGQRLKETAIARWANVNLEAETWTIPANEAKTGVANTIPLTPNLLAIFRRRKENEPDELYVFSHSPRTNVFWRSKRAAARLAEGTGIDFHAHDLRRTLQTGMARAGVMQEMIDRVTNHVPAGTTAISRVYNRYDYLPEKRVALVAWHSLLERIVRNELPAIDPREEAREEGRRQGIAEAEQRAREALAELHRLVAEAAAEAAAARTK